MTVAGTRGWRAVIWLFLWCALGGGLGFLSLELIGIPLLLVALSLIVWTGSKPGFTEKGLMWFGAGFVTSVSWFGVRWGVFSPDASTSGRLFFLTYFVAGLVMIAAGMGLELLSRERS